jgi:putative peptidoglycan lipid II flippase
MMALCLPAAALLAVTIRPLIAAFFGFEPAQVDLVTYCAWAFLIGLLGDAWLEVAVRSFYANQNTRTPLVAASIQATAFGVLAWLFSRWIGLPGIPLAAAVTFTVQAVALLFLLNRKFPGLLNMGKTFVRAAGAAVIGGGVAYGVLAALPVSGPVGAVAGLLAGFVVTLPFIWPEIRAIVKQIG